MFNLSRIRRALFGPTAFERKYEAAIARLEQIAMDASTIGKSVNYQGKAPAHFSAGKPILDLSEHPFNASFWWSSFEMADFFSRPQPEVTHVELSHFIGKGVCVKLALTTDGPIKPGQYTARIKSVHHTKETKPMAKVFDKNGKAHDAVNFVICVDEGNTRLLTQGKVYANLGATDNAYENIWIIDDRGLKQNFSVNRFQQFKSEKQNWGIACKQYANLNLGKLYNIEKNRPGVRSLDGTNQIACIDETGNWLTYNENVFSTIKPTFSEQYLTSKMMSAQQLANHTHSAPVSINLTQGVETADDKLKYVGVKFEPNGRVYTYKYIGKVKVGDKAVVDVRNSNYPELAGTKLVDVVSVSEANSSGFNSATLKWIVSVPDFEKYERRQQAEQLLREASARLDLEVQAEMDRRKQSVVMELAQTNPEIASLLQGIAALKDQLQ